MDKKILIFSSQPIRDDTNIGKTSLSLFKNIDKSQLSMFYMNPSIPNINLTDSNYQLDDRQLIKSFFGLIPSRCGKIVDNVVEDKSNVIKNNPEVFCNKNNIFFKILREMLWSFSFYKNNKLKQWLKWQNPDIIFAVFLDTNYSIKILKWMKKYTNSKLVLFVTDDYYHNYINKNNVFRRLFFYRKRKLLNNLIIDHIVGCSKVATDTFTKLLKVENGTTVYTPALEKYLKLPFKQKQENSIIRFRYFGNLGLNRWKVLADIGKVIQRINNGSNKAILEVYSGIIDKKIIDSLTIENGCIFKGWITGDEYIKELCESDVVLHVESFSQDIINRTYLSISTKITDYLSAGKCILAVGPDNIASIMHINDCSIVVSNLNDLEDKITMLINDSKLRSELQIKAREKSLALHDSVDINNKLNNVFVNL